MFPGFNIVSAVINILGKWKTSFKYNCEIACGGLYCAMAFNESGCRYYVCCSVCIFIYVFVSLGHTMQIVETISGKMKLPVAAVQPGTHLF